MDMVLYDYLNSTTGAATGAATTDATAVADLKKNEKFMQIQSSIALKRQQLTDNYKQVNVKSRQSQFLQGVLSDYSKYNDIIVKQKKEQIALLTKLAEYVDVIDDTTEVIKNQIHTEGKDQKNILNEIDKIKQSLSVFE